MAIEVKQLLKRHDRMRQEHQQWCPVWQDIADYMSPRKSQFTTVRSHGAKQTEKLFDSTALEAADRLASLMNGTLTSRAIDWFSLKVRDAALNENQEVAVWLEESTKRMIRAFNQSNFASEAHEIYLDLGSLATSCLFVEERNPSGTEFEGYVFTALPLHSIAIAEDHEGRVNTVFHTFRFTVAQAVAKWGLAQLGEKMKKKWDEGKTDEEFTILHAIEPRRIGVEKRPMAGTPATRLAFVDAYACIEDKKLLYEGGFHEFPCMVPRWAKTSGERYGRGPGHMALPDTKTLNKVVELGLKTWAKMLGMPTKSKEESIIGRINTHPDGNTVLRNIEDLQPLYQPGTFREAISNDQIKSQDLKQSIRRAFYADQMELPVGPQMTATEVLKRMELIYRVLGPTVGRFEAEFLNPLIYRTFGIAYRRKALDAAPEVLLKGGKLDIEYEGPLAKAQRLAEVEATERWVGVVATSTQLWPDVPDNVDSDELIRVSADALGVPKKFLRDADAVKKIRDTRAQQQQQQQQLANAEQAASTVGKVAPALKLMQGGASASAQ